MMLQPSIIPVPPPPQGDTTGQGADCQRTHISWVYVALRVIPLPLPQRCFCYRHHSGRRDPVHEKARQVPEDAEEGRERSEELLQGV